MPNNSNWVCFTCRVALREPAESTRATTCPACGDTCFNLGDKVPIPRKKNLRAWHSLQTDCRDRLHKQLTKNAEQEVRSIHALQREIARQEKLPSNTGRRRYLKQLNERLQNLRPN